MMIEQDYRKEYATIVVRTVSSRITFSEYFEQVSKLGKTDLAVREIRRIAIDPFFEELDDDDISMLDIDPADRRELAKIILFLRTGQEYEWPVIEKGTVVDKAIRIFTLGLGPPKYRYGTYEFEKQGCIDFWPFIDVSKYECALKSLIDRCSVRIVR